MGRLPAFPETLFLALPLHEGVLAVCQASLSHFSLLCFSKRLLLCRLRRPRGRLERHGGCSSGREAAETVGVEAGAVHGQRQGVGKKGVVRKRRRTWHNTGALKSVLHTVFPGRISGAVFSGGVVKTDSQLLHPCSCEKCEKCVAVERQTCFK